MRSVESAPQSTPAGVACVVAVSTCAPASQPSPSARRGRRRGQRCRRRLRGRRHLKFVDRRHDRCRLVDRPSSRRTRIEVAVPLAFPERAPSSVTATEPDTTRSTLPTASGPTCRSWSATFDTAGAASISSSRRCRVRRNTARPEPCHGHIHRLPARSAARRTGSCGESGFAFTVSAASRTAVSVRRCRPHLRPRVRIRSWGGNGNRAIPPSSSASQTVSRIVCLSMALWPPAADLLYADQRQQCGKRPNSRESGTTGVGRGLVSAWRVVRGRGLARFGHRRPGNVAVGVVAVRIELCSGVVGERDHASRRELVDVPHLTVTVELVSLAVGWRRVLSPRRRCVLGTETPSRAEG